ncbi:alpha-N-acetylneuraminide alpha-2,8-sialyltransferase-like isoform X2 [Rhineura floridana]|uniref:alpha-N-acetylneuraminide alpha-2,8-sialyltransferase-like isoform X2 n=1 Tax=Rhineura floridana TaxID=261503 RepID=UPI002AC7F613|nr:alpha-N-acetylneuraminide alpha-2,8-sialyltransferase-like isoform X2 [Rhineura floridana]
MSFNLQLGKQNFALGLCVVFLISLTLSLLQRAAREKTTLRQLGKCQELNCLFELRDFSQSARFNRTASDDLSGSAQFNRTASDDLSGSAQFSRTASDEEQLRVIQTWNFKKEDKKILEHLLLTQTCHWEPNAAVLAQYRAELGQCCNASFQLVLTKENTPLGSNISFDGHKDKKMLRSPFPDSQYGHCAVVGNSGILRNSQCGQEIDQADLVVRFNLPPMNFSEDVGTKASLVTLNPSILHAKFQKLEDRRKPFADALRPYRDALFLIPAFSFIGNHDVSYRALYTMEDFGLAQQAVFLNPNYLAHMGNYWRTKGLRPYRLSSGFMFVNVALELCKHITLYGFWPFQHDLANQRILHHYYDNTLPKRGVHAMPSEFSQYLRMYSQGVLRLRLGKCQ